MTTFRRLWNQRAACAAIGLAALSAATLTSSGAAATSAGAQPVAQAVVGTVAAAVGGPCVGAVPDQRVRVGSASDGADPNTLSLAQTARAQERVAARTQQRSAGREALKKATVDVHVHVITTDAGKGGVSTKRIKKQVAVLNKAYAGKTSKYSTKTPFTFKLKGIDRTASSAWYLWTPPTELSDGDDVEPKAALHKGDFGDLNLYVANIEGGVLGYSSFPWGTTLERDGVVVLNRALPGGSAKGYNKGDTVTHEVGHWLGLLHTFQNGCTAPGDLVSDTPYQADGDNVFSCSSKLDTCADKGKDPIHNFMSYGDDKCLTRFSKGQVQRMAQTWQDYRATPVVAG